MAPPNRFVLLAMLPLLPALVQPRARATLPLPTYPLCGSEPDHPDYCPNDFGDAWEYLSYIKNEYRDNVRAGEIDLGSGISLDKAMALEVGDFAITIADLDSGIRWQEGNLRRKWRLNIGELPLPQHTDGSTAFSYDLNGDGLVTIDDYAEDPRVSISAGNDAANDMLEPSDLIHTFSDGTDGDGNGYVDDICGWDFLWNDNDPFDDAENGGYSHGTGTLKKAAAEGGDGGTMGVCPNCSTLMLRAGDSFITESAAYAQAILYAVDNGVKVLMLELGGLNASSLARDALEYAWEHQVTVIASAADEVSIHANLPAALHHNIVVHPLTYSGTGEDDSNSFLVFNNCSDFGGRPTLSISSDGCSSEATAIAAGMAGLIHSASLHTGLALTANEVHQLFTQTADDVWVPEAYYGSQPQWYPSKQGFDRYFGYGRANIGRAIQHIYDGQIPPEADLLAPDWFEVIDPSRTPTIPLMGTVAANRSTGYRYVVEYGIGLDPEEFHTIAEVEGLTQPFEGTLASWDVSAIPTDQLDPTLSIPGFAPSDDVVTRVDKINLHAVAVRVRVIDAEGLEAEMRKTFYIHTDPEIMAGFPMDLGASLEPSPKLADLDGDGLNDIVQAGSDGVIHALRYDGSPLPGWPVQTGRLRTLDPSLPGNHAAAPAYGSDSVGIAHGQSMLGGVAIGDLDGDGGLEVVAATYDGGLFVWHGDGTPMDGFPVSLDHTLANQENAGPENLIEDGFMAAPALGDLNGDGFLDIVAAAMDQHVYAWDRFGESLEGWPVKTAYPFPRFGPIYGARIVAAPAIGDVNADGMMDVVIGTGEAIDLFYSPTYILHGDGNAHPGGPYHKGWPVLTIGLYASLLPDIGTGTTSSPALADLDGDGLLEIATHTIAGYSTRRFGSILRADGSTYLELDRQGRDFGGLSNANEPTVLPLITSGAFGDMDLDGILDYTLGMAGGSYLGALLASNKIIDASFSTAAWDTATGALLEGFPQVIADMQFLSHQILADVDGDGYPESISGNGAFTIHGFNHRGEQPEGWPKFTGQWVMATPAVGDLDGDGFLELVVGTRSGFLYVWHTTGLTAAQGGSVDWPSMHHDNYNSGNYHTIVP